jgi:hypothetical protein
MKIQAKSLNGQFLKIGNIPDSPWYRMTAAVKAELEANPIPADEEITIEQKSENSENYVTKIIRAGASSPVVKTPPVATGSTLNKGEAFNTPVAPQKPAVPGVKAPYLPKDEWVAKMKAEGKWDESKTKTGSYTKSPEEQNTIKRQAIGHMTSRSLASMQGIITPDNIEEIITKLYAKYVELVG